MEDIEKLDKLSPTLYCTGHIFYVKKKQYTLQESLMNMVGLRLARIDLICWSNRKLRNN